MDKKQCLEFFEIEDLLDLPKAVHNLLFGLSLEQRNKKFLKFLELNNYDTSYEWFQNIYEKELAERKDKKQDFTPKEVGEVLAKIVGASEKNKIYEPTAGNGGMIIQAWDEYKKGKLPWEAKVFFITAWELSDRTINILLLNLAIRGIAGYVFQGDVLEQKIKKKYILLNREDNFLGFSEIIEDASGDLCIVDEKTGKNILPFTNNIF